MKSLKRKILVNKLLNSLAIKQNISYCISIDKGGGR
jgi:hypothetical protein